MKKFKLIKSLTSLGTLAITFPVISSGCTQSGATQNNNKNSSKTPLTAKIIDVTNIK